jgi:hypothetical protein
MSVAATPASERGLAWLPDVPFASWFGLFRHIAIGGLAGLTAGVLIGGIGSRLFMRIAGAASGAEGLGRTTEAGFTVGEVTVGGTIGFVVFIGIFSGIVGAGMYLALRPWLGWAGRWRGVVFGVLLFGLTSATSDLMNPDNIDFFILGNGPLLVVLIAALFVAFGVVVEEAFRFLDARLPGDEAGWRSAGVVYVVFTAVGILAVASLGSAVLGGGEGICGCEAPVRASWSFVVVAASTVVLWIGAVTRLPSMFGRIASGTGYRGTAGVLVFGLIRAISDAADIVS